jgi:hypothetical protein
MPDSGVTDDMRLKGEDLERVGSEFGFVRMTSETDECFRARMLKFIQDRRPPGMVMGAVGTTLEIMLGNDPKKEDMWTELSKK